MKHYFLLVTAFLALSFWYQAHATTLSFLAPDYFMTIVAQEDQEAFKHFYRNFMGSLKTMKAAQKAKALEEVREFACNNLAVKHPLWAQELKPFNYFERSNKKMLNSEQCVQVRSFLTRYGVYETYLKDKAQQHASLWNKVKSYTKNIKNQLAHLTNSIKRTFWA
jgi:hypothetical protein